MISCIMPTSGRRGWCKHALRQFLAQDYADRELVVVDDGPSPIEDLFSERGPNVRYFYLGAEKRSIGEKRNFACEQARGEVIAHWDDDDWQHPNRLSQQLVVLADHEITGIDTELYFRPADGTVWRYTYWHSVPPYAIGNSFMYTRAAWQKYPFEHINDGEDTRFLWRNPAKLRLLPTAHPFVVGIIHGSNSGRKTLQPPFWMPEDVSTLRSLMGNDISFFMNPIDLR